MRELNFVCIVLANVFGTISIASLMEDKVLGTIVSVAVVVCNSLCFGLTLEAKASPKSEPAPKAHPEMNGQAKEISLIGISESLSRK